MFYVILTLHLIGVFAKLIVFFIIPRLKNVEQTKRFMIIYHKTDLTSDLIVWTTGLGFFFVTSFDLLLQPRFLFSMILYFIMFYVTKKILVRGMKSVVESGKLYAEKEIKLLRTQSWCAAIFIIIGFAGIGYFMANKGL